MSDNPSPPPNWKARLLARVAFALGTVILVARAVRRCFFGVLAFALSMAFFMLAPQGKEILSLVVEDPTMLIEALNGFSEAYHASLREAFTARFGVASRGEDADSALTIAALTFLRAAGEPMRWEPLFFDWFGGEASTARAMAGPRAALYAGPAFDAFRTALTGYAPLRPEVLADPYFGRAEPEEMLFPEVEAIWAPIAERDDWSALNAKISAIRVAAEAYGLEPFAD